jgi:8-oxo-dGTP diphosphatase
MKVAVGVITNPQQKILITRRPEHISYGGYWEFPGGKLEPNETAARALVRELKEEVGIDVLEHRFMGEVQYQYQEKHICLLVHHVSNFTGIAAVQEFQLGLRWVNIDELQQYDFPPANVEIIDLIHSKLEM